MKRKEVKWFVMLMEILGWVQIMLSPVLVAAVLAALYYLYSPNTIGIIGALIIMTIGLTIGIIWANRMKRKYGTIWFISRKRATTELDTNNFSTEELKKEAPAKDRIE